MLKLPRRGYADFTHRRSIPASRGFPEFWEKYGMRGGIERVFASWKDACNLERHRYRGLGNVSLHTLLTALGCEIKRLSVELFGKIRNPAG